MNSIKFGYGTSGIMGSAMSNSGRLALLQHAFENGVGHFDTAPLYGQGDAERVIGQFVENKREEVTITTKFGLSPIPYPPYLLPLKPLARYANRRVKQLKSLIDSNYRKSVSQAISNSQRLAPQRPTLNPYSAEEIISQLDFSLRKMKTAYVDYLLLHDCQFDNINDDVIRVLDQARAQGKVLQFGVATGKSHADAIVKQWPELGGVVQLQVEPFANSFYRAQQEDSLLISHSLFRGDLKGLQRDLSHHKPLLDQVVDGFGYHGIGMQEIISRFLIHHASRHNPAGILLFSSSSKKRLSNNIDAAKNNDLNQQLSECIVNLLESKA